MKSKLFILSTIAALLLPALVQAAPAGEKGKRPSPEERFNQADTNGDGLLSLDELNAARDKRTAQFFETIDTNGDGQLSPEELKAHRENMRENRKGKGKSGPLKAMDSDGSGTISLEEAEAANATRLVERFDEIDENGDGELSRDELAKLRQKMAGAAGKADQKKAGNKAKQK